ncbi:hypothetical protein GQ43DRAFT_481300 [Delitschia confertaspora ATCC 74209]|uniref:DUF3074 domain-containing protein n=1 Tax=Delitschia confertaspora ATCC 74209 TaxID=1513339 RepID=A0A9P4JKC8_9PLEO|nr:hypothetical protein GQ43DRAFT_481300 [Delitschia confertaspora ATCC 74209]
MNKPSVTAVMSRTSPLHTEASDNEQPSDNGKPTKRCHTAYLRLCEWSVNDIPLHDDVKDVQQQSALRLRDFLVEVLTEASTGTFDDVRTYQKRKKGFRFGDKNQYPKVTTYTKHIDGETWAARSSIHTSEYRAEATWDDFYRGLKVRHSQNERAYTEDIFDANTILAWDTEELEDAVKGTGWCGVTMEVNEIFHRLSFPLHNRVFTSLVLTAQKCDKDQFYIVQLPLLPLLSSPSSSSSSSSSSSPSSSNPIPSKSHLLPRPSRPCPSLTSTSASIFEYHTFHPTGDQKRHLHKPVIAGRYTSVERVTKMQVRGKEEIEWVMATASDARGVLPRWLQRGFVPRKIAMDVPWFLDWVTRVRFSAQ